MVKLTSICWKAKKLQFLDSLRVYVRGGAGGQGYPKFGGKGGDGGDVYVKCYDKAKSLKELAKRHPEKRFIAGNGGNSHARALLGEKGQDILLNVEPGILVKNDEGDILGSLDSNNDKILVAKGGAGGKSENKFQGEKGQSLSVTLDLRLIADVGLVGFPNAGKSTLLKAISNCKPEIAPWAFTTKNPQIGIVKYKDQRAISVADLPGIIEGASENIGLGHRFLKHIERTKLLLFMVDVHGFQLGLKYPKRTAFETIMLLNKEIELYNPELLQKPAILCINKVDAETLRKSEKEIKKTEECLHELKQQLANVEESSLQLEETSRPKTFLTFDDTLTISAKTSDNLEKLKIRIREIIDFHASETSAMIDLSTTRRKARIRTYDEQNTHQLV
ncbi:unnamed protein product [Owenia fusiformis]|uniref:Uncharacterized protein n=1 Tax=Owenia fusiformis TaxID=6347 RepID=A0A8J1Y4V6_OWEFU|nr:unnamed protein product [Owenia fusiformis]